MSIDAADILCMTSRNLYFKVEAVPGNDDLIPNLFGEGSLDGAFVTSGEREFC